MKKGDAPLLTRAIIGLVVGVVILIIFIIVFSDVIEVLFLEADECEASETGFNLLTRYVKGFIDGTYYEPKTVLIKLQEECSIVGFSSKGDSLLKAPSKCVGVSCLCLCYEGGDDKVDGSDCKSYNYCERFKEIEYITGEFDKQVIIEGDGLVRFFISGSGDNIWITDVKAFTDGSLSKGAYSVSQTCFDSTSGKQKADLRFYLKYYYGNNGEGFDVDGYNVYHSNGNIYFIPSQLSSQIGAVKQLKLSSDDLFNDLIDSYVEILTEEGVYNLDLSYDGRIELRKVGDELVFSNFKDGNLVESFGIWFEGEMYVVTNLAVVATCADIETSAEIGQSIYFGDYRINPSYNEDYQRKIAEAAQGLGVPVKLALAVALQESGIEHYDKKGEVKAGGEDGEDHGIMQINEEAHDYCFVESVTSLGPGICAHSPSCLNKNAKDINCNIEAGIRLLKENYDSDFCSSGAKRYPSRGDCYGFIAEYSGWDCALRRYNGWGCDPKGVQYYVRNVRAKIKEFA